HVLLRIGVTGEQRPALLEALGRDDVEPVVVVRQAIVVDRLGGRRHARVLVEDRDRQIVGGVADAVAAGVLQRDRRVLLRPEINRIVDRALRIAATAAGGG